VAEEGVSVGITGEVTALRLWLLAMICQRENAADSLAWLMNCNCVMCAVPWRKSHCEDHGVAGELVLSAGIGCRVAVGIGRNKCSCHAKQLPSAVAFSGVIDGVGCILM